MAKKKSARGRKPKQTTWTRKVPTRFISNGCYTGIAVQFGMDVEKHCQLIYDTGLLNGFSYHGATAWDNPQQQFPVKLELGKFRCAKRNDDYFDHIEALWRAAAKRKLTVLHKFFDQYNDVKWLTTKWKTCKLHWFRDNDASIRWEKPEPLYMNWNHKNASDPNNFAWFFFKTDDKDNITFWKPTNALGESMIHIYMEGIMDLLVKVREDFPDFRFRYCGFNESLLRTENNMWIAGGRDVDERSLRLLRDLWLKRGFQQVPNFRETLDVRIEEDGELNIARHKQMERILMGEVNTNDLVAADLEELAKPSFFHPEGIQMDAEEYRSERLPGIIKYAASTAGTTQLANDDFSAMAEVDPTPNVPRLVEIHGMSDGEECFEISSKLRDHMTFYESDGAKEDPTYYERMAQIERQTHKHVGYKMVPWGSWQSPSTWNSKDIDVNIKNSLPKPMNGIFKP